MKLATLCLGSCTGCHISLLDLGSTLTDILSQAELVFAPVLVDVKVIPAADLALVEGAPRNNEDLERLRILRDKTKTLVALGSCASFGGVNGLANVAPREEVLTGAYARPKNGTPSLTPRIYAVDHYVAVDWYIPGCPPPVTVLGATLSALMKGETPRRYTLPVCAECGRKAQPHVHERLYRTVEKTPDPQECLLSQGFVCLGSVTRSGCGGTCTKANVPCLGCRGPVDKIFTETRHGVFQDLVSRRARLLGRPESEVEGQIYDLGHTLYAFTLGHAAFREKRAERTARMTYRVNVAPGERL